MYIYIRVYTNNQKNKRKTTAFLPTERFAVVECSMYGGKCIAPWRKIVILDFRSFFRNSTIEIYNIFKSLFSAGR